MPLQCSKTYSGGHTCEQYAVSAVFSTLGGRFVVSGSEDGHVYWYELQSKAVAGAVPVHTCASCVPAMRAVCCVPCAMCRVPPLPPLLLLLHASANAVVAAPVLCIDTAVTTTDANGVRTGLLAAGGTQGDHTTKILRCRC